MINAKEELLDTLAKISSPVLCAVVWFDKDYTGSDDVKAVLPVDYTPKQYESFLKALDFKYSDSYGLQQLYGTVWLEDGTWLERGEYDGSEWWEHKSCPVIPSELKSQNSD